MFTRNNNLTINATSNDASILCKCGMMKSYGSCWSLMDLGHQKKL